MKTLLKIRIGILSALLLAHTSWSKDVSIDCPKISEGLCTTLETKSNDDTIYVDFYLRLPYARPDSCLYNQHPDSICIDNREDSVFWAKLAKENKEVYATYSSKMMDVMNPSQSRPYQGDSAGMIFGAIVTKSNLYAIVQDTNLLSAEPFLFPQTTKLIYPQITDYPSNQTENWSLFSVNGQAVPAIRRAKSFTVKMRRR